VPAGGCGGLVRSARVTDVLSRADESGAAADIWKKSLGKSAHGKSLPLLLHGLQSKCKNPIASGLNLFKTFRQLAGAGGNVITLTEFRRVCEKLNLPMTSQHMDDLFDDLNTNHDAELSSGGGGSGAVASAAPCDLLFGLGFPCATSVLVCSCHSKCRERSRLSDSRLMLSALNISADAVDGISTEEFRRNIEEGLGELGRTDQLTQHVHVTGRGN
jgi:hypothetical protein